MAKQSPNNQDAARLHSGVYPELVEGVARNDMFSRSIVLTPLERITEMASF